MSTITHRDVDEDAVVADADWVYEDGDLSLGTAEVDGVHVVVEVCDASVDVATVDESAVETEARRRANDYLHAVVSIGDDAESYVVTYYGVEIDVRSEYGRALGAALADGADLRTARVVAALAAGGAA